MSTQAVRPRISVVCAIARYRLTSKVNSGSDYGAVDKGDYAGPANGIITPCIATAACIRCKIERTYNRECTGLILRSAFSVAALKLSRFVSQLGHRFGHFSSHDSATRSVAAWWWVAFLKLKLSNERDATLAINPLPGLSCGELSDREKQHGTFFPACLRRQANSKGGDEGVRVSSFFFQ